jgi:hypothetical protein
MARSRFYSPLDAFGAFSRTSSDSTPRTLALDAIERLAAVSSRAEDYIRVRLLLRLDHPRTASAAARVRSSDQSRRPTRIAREEPTRLPARIAAGKCRR